MHRVQRHAIIMATAYIGCYFYSAALKQYNFLPPVIESGMTFGAAVAFQYNVSVRLSRILGW